MSPKERARLMAERYNLVGSAIDEMSWWAAFSADDTQTPRHAGVERQFVEQTSGGTDGSKTIWSSGRPMRSELKTGRNDPCPCGSGKKFKKCCLVAPPSPR
ncbi:MAG: SEC-C domain-containing protein [Verrucomicrobiales bacterium]|nr:SEC-C domain-containing protein [Verrucomicrobiales bacterium]